MTISEVHCSECQKVVILGQRIVMLDGRGPMHWVCVPRDEGVKSHGPTKGYRKALRLGGIDVTRVTDTPSQDRRSPRARH